MVGWLSTYLNVIIGSLTRSRVYVWYFAFWLTVNCIIKHENSLARLLNFCCCGCTKWLMFDIKRVVVDHIIFCGWTQFKLIYFGVDIKNVCICYYSLKTHTLLLWEVIRNNFLKIVSFLQQRTVVTSIAITKLKKKKIPVWFIPWWRQRQ